MFRADAAADTEAEEEEVNSEDRNMGNVCLDLISQQGRRLTRSRHIVGSVSGVKTGRCNPSWEGNGIRQLPGI